jgi:hypothetical protein
MDRLAISPEPFVQKCMSLLKADRLYLDVRDGSIRLSWIDSSGKAGSIDGVEATRLGISYKILLDALSEAGGDISMDGRYPVNSAIGQKLRS